MEFSTLNDIGAIRDLPATHEDAVTTSSSLSTAIK
jgi:hypothetical protein